MPIRYLSLVILLSVVIYLPSINNFFSGDDWFHLRLIQIENFWEIFQFFSFLPNEHAAAFYRPLSTQLFFFVFHYFFDLNPIPYHIFSILVLFFTYLLIYKTALVLFKDKLVSCYSILFYSLSVTHFTRLYLLSAFQEILMTFFSILAFYFYITSTTKNFLFSVLFFILALLSKETAVTLPLIIAVYSLLWKKIELKKIIPFVAIAVFYLYLRFTFFGIAQGDSYIWDFSPLKALNTLFWYYNFSLGVPEFLVDYVASGLQILPRYYELFPFWSKALIYLILSTNLILFLLVLRSTKSVHKLLFPILLFILGLLPVIFLPFHKFTLELSLPMIGFSFSLGLLMSREKLKVLTVSFLIFFILLNLLSNYLTFKTNYSVNRAVLALKVYEYFRENYPEYPKSKYFEFTNGGIESSENWGVSRQISQAISKSDMHRVLYKDKNIQVFFEDFDEEKPQNLQPIKINSLDFLIAK